MAKQKAGSQPIPFKTNNGTQAFCLDIAGVPPADPLHPVVNIYDADILRGLGFPPGCDIFEAARAAHKARKKGQVEYGFEITNELQSLNQAFDDQQKKIGAKSKKGERGEDQTAAKMALGIVQKFSSGQISEAEMIIRLACVFEKARSLFINAWHEVDPIIRLQKGRKVDNRKADGTGTVKMPAFVACNLGASNELKQHLKIQ